MLAGSTRSLRPLIRIGWRSIRKSPLRSLLVFVLVALVVGAGTFAAITNRSTSVSQEDVKLAEFGEGNFRADFETQRYGSGGPFGGPIQVPIDIVLPPGVPAPVLVEPSPDAVNEQRDADLAWLASFDVRDAERRIEQTLGIDVSIERQSIAARFEGPFGSRGPVVNLISDLDPSHPAAAGASNLVVGRLPTSPGEIAVQDQGRVGQPQIGDQITLGSAELTVVGFVTSPANRYTGEAIVTPASFDRIVNAETGISFAVRAKVPGGPVAVQRAAAEIAAIVERQVTARTPDSLLVPQNGGYTTYPGSSAEYYRVQPVVPQVWPILISTVLATQIALVCAAAFAVGIRRRTREFGQLMTLGADDRHVRQLAQVEAALLGLTGATLGLVLGVVAASIAIPAGWLDSVGNRTPTGVRWSIVDWLGPAAVGIVAVVVAAWWPIRVLAKAPIPGVLEGRLPAVPVKKATPRWGLVLVAAGGLLLGVGARTLSGGTPNPSTAFAILVLGVVTMIAGSILLIGTVLSLLGSRANRLPLLARLAVRNSDRQRSRSWVVVGAFIAALAIPVLIGASIKAYPNSYRAIEPSEFNARLLTTARVEYGPPSRDAIQIDGDLAEFDSDFATEIDEQFPIAGTVDFVTAPLAQISWLINGGGRSSGQIVVATNELRQLFDLDDELVAKLDGGAALDVSTYRENYRGQPLLGLTANWGTGVPIELVDGPSIFSHDTWLIGEETLADIGAVSVVTGSVRVLERPLTTADEETIRQLGNELWTERFGAFSYEQRIADDAAAQPWLDLRITRNNSFGTSANTVRLWSTLISIGLAVLVALVTASLSAVEMTGDIESMIATGASPSIRRRLLGAQTLYHLLVAALLAIPLAVLAFWVATSGDDYRAAPGLTVPWLSILITVLIAPVVALLVSAIFRNGKPAVSRRLS